MPRRRGRGRRGLVTLVVPVTDTHQPFVDECLDSLRFQTHGQLQILVVPYGASAGVVRLARRHAADDWRVRILEDDAPDLGAAWDRGVAAAAGRFLCLVAGADRMPPQATGRLVAALERSGSDFAVGRRGDGGIASATTRRLRARVHERQRLAVRLEEFPAALLDVEVENRMFRTEFWRRCGGRFAGAERAVLTMPVVSAYLQADRFDVLPEVTYLDMNRGRGLPFGHLPNAMQDLAEWVRAQHGIRSWLEEAGSRALLEAWLYGVLEQGALPFLDDCERATAEQWQMLSHQVAELVGDASPELWATVRAETKVKLWLAAHGHREALEDFVSRRWFADGNVPTSVEAGTVRALLPYHDTAEPAVPDDCFVMAVEETGLVCSLRGARWTQEGRLQLELYTFVSFVDMADETPSVQARLVGPDGTTQPLALRQHRDAGATRFGGHRFQRYDAGAVVAELDPWALVADAAKPDDLAPEEWRFEVTVTSHGVTRTGTVTHVDTEGSAVNLSPRLLGDRLVGLRAGSGSGAVVEVLPSRAAMSTLQVSGRTVRGRLAVLPDEPGTGAWQLVARHAGGRSVACRLEAGGSSFELDLPDVGSTNEPDQRRTWTVRLRRSGQEVPVAWPVDVESAWVSGSEVAWHRTDGGNCELREVRHVPALSGVSVDGDELVLTGRWLGTPPPGAVMRLEDHRHAVEGPMSAGEDGRFVARLPLRSSRWEFPVQPLPSGGYRLHPAWRRGEELVHGDSVALDDALRDLLPVEQLGSTHRVRAFRGAAGRVAIRLSAPLTDDERGAYAQQRLQTELVESTEPLDPHAVYLQAYAGGTATDSQLAIHEELRRRDPSWKLYWGVSDLSAMVPEGAIPVLMRSRAWYDVLATAGYLVNNIDFDRWFEKRPGQRFLQTFHGYPAKAMGIGLWTAKQFTPRRIDLELERTSRDWDLILTPDPSMDQYYRREYRYEGAIHNKGYPRDDVLVSADSARVRAATRERLGIRDEQTAVLYAPTWRDDLAKNYRSARLVQHLDLETASAALGDDFVLLMRGHRFHARAPQRAEESARVLDVTDYPEINDLILAADVAVLDYSSLRFDFALTGKPMLFLVPDLHLYTGGVRGFLYDYRESAPGPLLDTADEVVAALRDLDAVRQSHAGAQKRFNERFQRWHDGHAAERVVEAFFDPPAVERP